MKRVVHRPAVLALPILVVLGLGLAAIPTYAQPLGAGQDAVRNGPLSTTLSVGFSAAPSLPAAYPSLWDVAAAYDTARSQIVLFGGAPLDVSGTFSNQTWLFVNQSWVQGPNAPTGMGARSGGAMAYDPDIAKTVLFGGSNGTWPPLGDTWLFDGTKWTKGPSAPVGLVGRYGAEMVYDPAISKLVLFGGSGLAPYNDTWLFDGTKWTAGPAAPAGMASRGFFGMAYDPTSLKVVLAGGDGSTTTWLFDGTKWTAGPALPLALERFRMDYDPDVGGVVIFGGVGPAWSSKQMWKLAGGTWTKIKCTSGATWPTRRVDAAVVFDPSVAALVVIGGIDATNGAVMLREVWYYSASAPSIQSISLAPPVPTIKDDLVSTLGAITGGLPPITVAYAWYKNDTVVDGQVGPKLPAGTAVHNDQVYVKAQATDALGLKSPWVKSNTVTVANTAPTMGPIILRSGTIYTGDTVTVTLGNVSDADGDPVTVHYAWSVNGVTISGYDQPTLTPDRYTGGDSIAVTCTPTDSLGLSGPPVSAPAKTAQWRLYLGGGKVPGATMLVTGNAYSPNEKVDIRADSPTGTLLGTATADGTGTFTGYGVTLPNPYPGGTHTMYGIGKTSGLVGTGLVTITPVLSLSVTSLAAGDTTTATAIAFVPGETVGLSFPGGTTVNGVADANGSVVAVLQSPAEPAPSGLVTATAPSGTAHATYYTKGVLTVPATGKPGASIAFSATGFGATESVTLAIDRATVGTYTTGSNGSLSSTFVLNVLWGSHNVTLTGATSGVTKSAPLSATAWVTLNPNQGPVGATVTVTSGPGWTPGEMTHLKWNGVKILDLVANAAGTVGGTFTVPSSSGVVTVQLYGDVSGASATTTFTVTHGPMEVDRR